MNLIFLAAFVIAVTRRATGWAVFWFLLFIL